MIVNILILFYWKLEIEPAEGATGSVSFCAIAINKIGNNLPCVSSMLKNQSFLYDQNNNKISDTADAGMMCNISSYKIYYFKNSRN